MSKKNAKTQVNEFDETLAASKSFFEKNQRAILWGGGGLLAIVIIALLVHQFYITPLNNRANESIFHAEQAFIDGNYEKALNGDGESMGFLAVIDEFGNTKAGNIACLYAAKCYAATEKYQEAIEMLDRFSNCDDEMISPAAIALKGNCYAELGENGTIEHCHDLLSGKAAHGKDIFGAVYNPFNGELFHARLGEGAYLNERPIHVADRPLDVAVVAMGTCPYYRDTLGENTFAFARDLYFHTSNSQTFT